MINILPARGKDAKELLEVQWECFSPYLDKYEKFDSNPCYMTLHRMEFNLKYQYGYYYKLVDFVTDKIVGGIFIFECDSEEVMQIAQFYLKKEYQHQGIGTKVLEAVMKKHSDVTTWYVDTILQEEYNVKFYEALGFQEIDREEENDDLTFVTFIKK